MSPEDRRTLRLYQGFQFCFLLLFWLPIFYEYQKRIGLTDPQIFGIQSLYYAVFCVLEIPTGMVADQVGYRRSMRIGAVVMVLTNLFPIFMPSYEGFVLHFLGIALSRSFISGASSAYLYRFLQVKGLEAEYKEVEGRARALGLLGKVVGWSFVGAAMEWELTAPYWLTVGSTGLAVAFAWALPQVMAPAIEGEEGRLTRRLRRSFALVRGSPPLILGILQGVALFVLVRICQLNLFQPILDAKDVPVAWYGAVMAGMTLFEAAGSARPGWVRRFMGDSTAVVVMSTVLGVTLVFIPEVSREWTLVLLGVFAFAGGLTFPLQRQVLNDAIPDTRYRATILSMESIVDRAVNAGVAAAVGEYLVRGELDVFLRGAAVVTVVVMALLYGARRRLEAREAASDPGASEEPEAEA